MVMSFYIYYLLNHFLLFFDVKKAFDTVWREGLLYKLLQSGINLKLFQLISGIQGVP